MATAHPEHGADRLVEADAGVDIDPVLGVPSDNTTLVDVLAGMTAEGYGASFAATEAGVRCGACSQVSDAVSFGVDALRRLEGASDPDDMVVVVAARCPACAALGTIVLGVGPIASQEDADVVAALPDA